MSVTIVSTPITNQLNQLDEFADAMLKAFGQALDEEAELTARLAAEFVPLDTGALADSAVIGNVERTGDTFKTFVSFGGPSAPYGVFVHEDLQAHHSSGANRGAKFLTRAVDELAPTRRERIERVLDAKVKP